MSVGCNAFMTCLARAVAVLSLLEERSKDGEGEEKKPRTFLEPASLLEAYVLRGSSPEVGSLVESSIQSSL